MKTFRLIAVSFVFAALFAVSAIAQTTPANTAQPRIGFINTLAFGADKNGITKFVTAVNALDTEFKPAYTELQKMIDDYQKLGDEIKRLQVEMQKANSPISAQSVQTKIDQFQGLEVRIKRQKEDTDAKAEKRKLERLGPIEQDIAKAMQEFATQKGYAVILDAAKLDRAGIILAWDGKADVTDDFIKFYNARPATTTATK